jgi:hypothetical protein
MKSRGDPARDCAYNNRTDKGPKITYINQERRLDSAKFDIIRITIK